jgi:Fic-DOC domain mobile mystery protein B
MSIWPTIPGETPIDPTGLKDKGIRNRDQLNVVEAQNIRKVVVAYLSVKPTRKSAPFDYGWCLRLHEEMYEDVWTWAGKLRDRDVNIGIPFAAIPESLAMLLGNLQSWSGYNMDMIEQATRLHHGAVKIHPFLNGNGRWSRMLANIWLKLNGHPVIVWPDETINRASPVRGKYIEAVKKADDGYYEELIEMHKQYVENDAASG